MRTETTSCSATLTFNMSLPVTDETLVANVTALGKDLQFIQRLCNGPPPPPGATPMLGCLRKRIQDALHRAKPHEGTKR